jgi:sigma-B regulation protein RsbU (phosphoserine phosphatase)
VTVVHAESFRVSLVPSFTTPLQTIAAADGDSAENLVTVHLPELCRAFEQATGWPLRYVPAVAPIDSDVPFVDDPGCAWWHGVSVSDSVVGYLRMDLPGPADEVADLHAAGELGDQIGLLVGQLLDCTQRLNEREVELATLVDLEALAAQPANLQQALVAALGSAVEAVGARSAALFLLDPSVTWLTLRAIYNLRPDQTPPSPRDLRLAPYDLESLTGKPVVVEDPRRVLAARHGHPLDSHPRQEGGSTGLPESSLAATAAWCPPGHLSGVCVAVGSESMPLGTLWVYGDELRPFTPHQVRLIQAASNRIAATLDHVVLVRDSGVKRRLTRELSVASHVQAYLLPEKVPQHARYELAAWTRPCREIGGDLYDLIPVDRDRLGIAVGDASGKSIPAAIMMASARGGLRAYVETGQGVDEVIARLNGNLWTSTRGEHFMSLFYGVLDPNKRRLEYTSAGHPATLLFRGAEVQELRSSGLVLGVTRDARYEKVSLGLKTGDVLVLYTDGISESSDAERNLFGSVGIVSAVRPWLSESADQILERLRAAVEAFGREGPYQDDMTILVLKIR